MPLSPLITCSVCPAVCRSQLLMQRRGNTDQSAKFPFIIENTLRAFPKKCRFYLFPPCFLLLKVFYLIAEDSSPQRLEVFPSCGESGGSCRITLWLSHAKSAASLSTQTYIPPLPATAAVAAAGSQRGEAAAPCHRRLRERYCPATHLCRKEPVGAHVGCCYDYTAHIFFNSRKEHFTLICCVPAAVDATSLRLKPLYSAVSLLRLVSENSVPVSVLQHVGVYSGRW